MTGLELPMFIVGSLVTWDEDEAWSMLEGVPNGEVLRVDSWEGRVIATSDTEGLVEPVAFA